MEKNYTKDTLRHFSKEEIIKHCICLQHNNKALREMFEIQYGNCMKIVQDLNFLNDTLKNSKRLTAQ